MFLRCGVAVTAYDGGFIRTSLPVKPLSTEAIDQVLFAMQRCS
jgi:hypothetical protein